MTTPNPPSTLIVGPSWIGDMVMAQSLFRVLKDRAPEENIDVIAPEWSLPLLKRMPEVRQGIALPVQHGELGLKKRWQLGRKLQRRQYRKAIVLPRSIKSALVPFFARIPIRIGYLGEQRYGLLTDIRKLNKDTHYRTVDRFIALGRPRSKSMAVPLTSAFYPRLETNKPIDTRTVTETVTDTAPIAALCPGAEYGPAKQWPAEYFAQLAGELITNGWQVWILGSEKDSHAANQITEHLLTSQSTVPAYSNRCTDLTGQTTLPQAIDLLARATVTVSNDSGLMHIAAATGCPVIALYGSSDPNFTPPLSENAKVLYRNLSCSPCFQRECPLGHLNCLKKITPPEVRATIAEIILEGQPPVE